MDSKELGFKLVNFSSFVRNEVHDSPAVSADGVAIHSRAIFTSEFFPLTSINMPRWNSTLVTPIRDSRRSELLTVLCF